MSLAEYWRQRLKRKGLRLDSDGDCRFRCVRKARRNGGPAAGWKEIDGLESASQFTMKELLARLKRKKPSVLPRPQRLPAS